MIYWSIFYGIIQTSYWVILKLYLSIYISYPHPIIIITTLLLISSSTSSQLSNHCRVVIDSNFDSTALFFYGLDNGLAPTGLYPSAGSWWYSTIFSSSCTLRYRTYNAQLLLLNYSSSKKYHLSLNHIALQYILLKISDRLVKDLKDKMEYS